MKYFGCFKTGIAICFFTGGLILFSACAKGKREGTAATILSPLDSMYKLAGTWPIRGYEDSNQIDISDTIFALNDTAILLTVVNDSTLSIGNDLLHYISTSSNDTMLYYWYVAPGPVWNQLSVSYYFLKDSIFFDHLRLAGPNNGYIEDRYHSY